MFSDNSKIRKGYKCITRQRHCNECSAVAHCYKLYFLWGGLGWERVSANAMSRNRCLYLVKFAADFDARAASNGFSFLTGAEQDLVAFLCAGDVSVS